MNAKQTGLAILSLIAKIVFLVVAAMLIIRAADIAYEYGYQIYDQQPMTRGEGRVVAVTVPEEASVSEIAALLEEKGLIRDTLLFRLQERFSRYHGKLQAGTYELSSAMTPEEMMQIMASDDGTSSEEDAEASAEAAEDVREPAFPDDDLLREEGFGDFPEEEMPGEEIPGEDAVQPQE